MSITVDSVTKRFGNFLALDNVNLHVPSGRLVALLGPSGSGKTTLLRIIAGLEQADQGTIFHLDEEITHRSARDRQMGFVFQHYALFRHMTVFENIAFGLRVRHRPEDQIRQRVLELLHLIRLEGLEGRFPSQLSGGQRQRVALARALAVQPRVLLLDEPFGALDAKVRQELRQWIRSLHEQIHLTSVFVTHDQEEAFEVADEVVVMNAGHIEQSGSPELVFEQPANAFVMDFLGNVNVFAGRVHNGAAHLGNLQLAYPSYPHAEERSANVYMRPHELDLNLMPNGRPSLLAKVVHVNRARAVARVELFAEEFGATILADVAASRCDELNLSSGQAVYVSPKRITVFVPDYSI